MEPCAPSVQPDTPRVSAFARTRRERAVLFLPSPEEQSIIWMVRPVHRDVASPVTSRDREGHIGQRLGHLVIWPKQSTIIEASESLNMILTRLPVGTEVPCWFSGIVVREAAGRGAWLLRVDRAKERREGEPRSELVRTAHTGAYGVVKVVRRRGLLHPEASPLYNAACIGNGDVQIAQRSW